MCLKLQSKNSAPNNIYLHDIYCLIIRRFIYKNLFGISSKMIAVVFPEECVYLLSAYLVIRFLTSLSIVETILLAFLVLGIVIGMCIYSLFIPHSKHHRNQFQIYIEKEDNMKETNEEKEAELEEMLEKDTECLESIQPNEETSEFADLLQKSLDKLETM